MRDQFEGCLLGLAVGEALGLTADGLDKAQLKQHHGRITDLRGAEPGSLVETGAATAQMLCVLESYTGQHAFDPHDISDRILEWYQLNPAPAGRMTHAACRKLAEGYNFERAGRDAWQEAPPADRLDPGSLARVAPAALLHYHDDVHLIGESRLISGITHSDETCKLACAAFSLAIAHLMMVGPDGLREELLEFIAPRNEHLGAVLKAIPTAGPQQLNPRGNVADILQAALWAAIYCDHYREALLLLVNLGGQAATLGATAGALMGARLGQERLPANWTGRIKDHERIREGARRLYAFSLEF